MTLLSFTSYSYKNRKYVTQVKYKSTSHKNCLATWHTFSFININFVWLKIVACWTQMRTVWIFALYYVTISSELATDLVRAATLLTSNFPTWTESRVVFSLFFFNLKDILKKWPAMYELNVFTGSPLPGLSHCLTKVIFVDVLASASELSSVYFYIEIAPFLSAFMAANIRNIKFMWLHSTFLTLVVEWRLHLV